MALMDIAGKVLGIPCHSLLGSTDRKSPFQDLEPPSKLRDRIPMYCDTVASVDKEIMKNYMQRRIEKGFHHLLGCGFGHVVPRDWNHPWKWLG